MSLAPPPATRSKLVPEDARRHNRALVLRHLFETGPQSRADLARSTGLTPVTVSDLVGNLIADGLVAELGRRQDPGPGKPAIVLGLQPKARVVVALDLSDGDRVHGALVDLSGSIVGRAHGSRHGRTGDDAVQAGYEVLSELMASASQPVLGIGIASPGIVSGDGTVLQAANLRWEGLPLAARVRSRFPVPVHVLNDANAAVLAESSLAGPVNTNVVAVKVAGGVGLGLVVDGRLHAGERWSAGEVGHVTVDDRGQECACGRRGCLETEVLHGLDRAGSLEGRARTRALATAGNRLGAALAVVVGTLDIADVVLSGRPEIGEEAFLDAVRTTIVRRTLPSLAAHVRVRPSSLDGDDVLLGAAAVVLGRELGVV